MYNVLLLEKIEKCREEMIALSNLYGMTSLPAIQASENLDKLLNTYGSNLENDKGSNQYLR